MEYWQSEKILGIPKQISKKELVYSTRFYTKYLIEDSITKKCFSLFQFPRQSLPCHLCTQLSAILNCYRNTLHYNSLKPLLTFQQSRLSTDILLPTQKLTLRSLILSRKSLTEFQAKYFLTELYFALNYLQSKQLQLEWFGCNEVGLDEAMRPCIDFMVCLRVEADKTFTRYLGAEVGLRVCPWGPEWRDVWNLGLCLYEMVEGRELITSQRKRSDVVKGKIPFAKNHTSECQDLIVKLLHPNQKKRLKLTNIFQHKWLKQGDPLPQMLPKTIVFCPPSQQFRQQTRNLQPFQKPFVQHRSQAMIDNLTSQHNIILKSERRIDKEYGQLGGNKTFKEFLENNEESEYEVYVEDLSDISRVFGYGYRMSNGVIGFFFNDRTLLLKIPNKNYYYFDENWEFKTIKQEKVPDQNDLRKKYYILEAYIKSAMQFQSRCSKPSKHPFETLIYIKQYIKTNNAKLYLLSNETVQAQFIDRTQIMATRTAAFFDERKFEWREVKPDDSDDVLIREKYTKELARKLMSWGAGWAELGAGEIQEDFQGDG